MDIKSIQRRRTDKSLTDYRLQFQTPPPVAAYMASLIPVGAKKILEPTPGAGNLVRAIQSAGGGIK